MDQGEGNDLRGSCASSRRRNRTVPLLVVLFLLYLSVPLFASDRATVESMRRSTAVLMQSGQAICGAVFRSATVVLTAFHCVREGGEFSVLSESGAVVSAVLLRGSVERDLALLLLAQPMPEARIAPIEQDVAVGDTVWLIGAPLGTPFMVSRGIISGMGVTTFSNCSNQQRVGTAEQQILAVDALTLPGNSGGPLFDDKASLIGVLVRVNVWQGTCTRQGTQTLWGLAVGPASLQDFLEGR